MVFLLFIAASIAQTPNCTWQCDDPICSADCRPICQPPVCTYINCSGTPICWITCETTNINAIDACPLCTTQCNPAPVPCVTQCEESQCNWECSLPMYCPKPDCRLQCELPACGPSVGSILRATWSTMILLSVLFLFSE